MVDRHPREGKVKVLGERNDPKAWKFGIKDNPKARGGN